MKERSITPRSYSRDQKDRSLSARGNTSNSSRKISAKVVTTPKLTEESLDYHNKKYSMY